MRRILSLLIILAVVVASPGCTSKPQVDPNDPKSVLAHYFELLVKEDYSSLVEYYGGSYEQLQGWAPQVDPDDKATLFHNYIHITGGQIVRLNEIVSEKQISPEHYEFQVNFLRPDGESFRNGQLHFYNVQKIDGVYKVMDVPPYAA